MAKTMNDNAIELAAFYSLKDVNVSVWGTNDVKMITVCERWFRRFLCNFIDIICAVQLHAKWIDDSIFYAFEV